VPVAVAAVLVAQVLLDPPLWIGLTIAGAVALAYIAATHRLLHLGQTFPELRRLPLARRLIDS
jgi:hypothetical protein